MTTSNRVVIYARISEDRTGEGVGIGRQVDDCQQLAKSRGLRVVEVIEENDTSAYGRKPRPGWKRLVEMARRGEVDGVVAWHADRLYRHPKDLEDIIDMVQTTKLSVFTVTAGDLDLSTPSGRTVARMLGVAARGEVERAAERIARAHRQKAERGEWKGGRRPWGYETDGVTIREAEARALREAAQMILAGSTIAAAARHVGNVTGRPINRVTLRDALMSPRIVGFRQHIPQAERDAWERRRRENTTAIPASLSRPEPRLTPAVWPAILDMETWHALRAKFRDPEQLSGRSRRPRRSMLAGLLVCGECYKEDDETGRPVVSKLQVGSKSYSCQRCGRVAIGREPVERLITTKVEEVLRRAPQELEASTAPATEWASVREELDARERSLTTARLEGLLSDEAFREGLAKLAERRAQITHEEDRAHLEVVRRRQRAALLPTWERASPVEKGHVIAQVADYFLVDRVGRTGRTFQPGRVSAHWLDQPDRLSRLGPDPRPLPEQESQEEREQRRADAKRERQRRYRERQRKRGA